jgi:hypothetical protein
MLAKVRETMNVTRRGNLAHIRKHVAQLFGDIITPIGTESLAAAMKIKQLYVAVQFACERYAPERVVSVEHQSFHARVSEALGLSSASTWTVFADYMSSYREQYILEVERDIVSKHNGNRGSIDQLLAKDYRPPKRKK